MITKIPGLKCQHSIISPQCRKSGNMVAYLKAEAVLKKHYMSLVNCDVSEKAKFHIVLTVEHEEETSEKA
jgi:hypothetical protein